MDLDMIDTFGCIATIVLVFLSLLAALAYYRSSANTSVRERERRRDEEDRLRSLGS